MSADQKPLEKPLSRKALCFAELLGWSQDFNATRCAREAGYGEKSARRTASDLLADPRVKAIVDGIMAQRLAESRIRPDRVLEELAAVAFSSIDDYEPIPLLETMATTGKPDALGVRAKASAAPNAMRAVKKVTLEQHENVNGRFVTEVRLELYDKVAALAQAMKHLGMLKDKVEHSGPNGAPIEHAHNHSITVRFVKPGEVGK